MSSSANIHVEALLDELVQQFSNPVACFRELVQNALDAADMEASVDVTAGGTLRVSRHAPVVPHALETLERHGELDCVTEAWVVAWAYGELAGRLEGVGREEVAEVDLRQIVRVWRRG